MNFLPALNTLTFYVFTAIIIILRKKNQFFMDQCFKNFTAFKIKLVTALLIPNFIIFKNNYFEAFLAGFRIFLTFLHFYENIRIC